MKFIFNGTREQAVNAIGKAIGKSCIISSFSFELGNPSVVDIWELSGVALKFGIHQTAPPETEGLIGHAIF